MGIRKDEGNKRKYWESKERLMTELHGTCARSDLTCFSPQVFFMKPLGIDTKTDNLRGEMLKSKGLSRYRQTKRVSTAGIDFDF